ncbi:PREDICTED: uncharacterized protein LOC109152288 [Ipomoea nil]|uniref:uncharacterized protein LOC109152288 n=1 Tax=Ipomoea nil TaxID=35883 RepID=UPI00090181F5|nr:PREDICTED: uncharacterized protein LOC109152288 [Ipomoea nil]XP_019155430.1 PREDICTED: uncharacterized protein LOC109152288 [Ipomoea nil]XP_019155431.1 PREDICTED: uncharacterized protein LOC109152288 [Ipomoea nil]
MTSSPASGNALVVGLSKALLVSGVVFFLGIVLIPNARNCPSDLAHVGESEAGVAAAEAASTNMSHLIFGIVGSEGAWHNRKAYVESWWRPNVTRGHILLDKEPTGDLLPWSPQSPPYKISYNITEVVNKTKHVDARVARMVHGISEIVREAGEGVRWVVMGDDDSIFMVDNIVDLVAQYDHTKFFYIGGHSEFVLSNFWFSFNQAFGGAGIILSYPLAKALSDDIMGCLKRYSRFTSADKTTMSCVSDLGVNISPHSGFHQMDMRGDVSGFLSYHPNVPLMSLHHFDMADPIFPFTDRAESARRLMKPAELDQTRILQQAICYERRLRWSFSVSWGYSAQIYERIMPRSHLQNPIETFVKWRESSAPPFWMFDVRRRSGDPCEAPHFFFFKTVKKLAPPRDEIVTTYHRSWKRGMGPCSVGGNRSADQISKIQVFSPAERRLRNDRSECCSIEQVSKTRATIKLRSCKIDEVIA